jgi:hypothetical protein
MAGKSLQLFPDPLITNADMSTSFNGTPTNIQVYDNVGIQLKWAGASPGGAINVQVSLDYDPRFPSNGTWTLLETAGTPIVISPGGTPGTGYVDLNQLSAQWVQVVYTTAGGSVGTLTSKIAGKAV